ncbi:THUMP domain-containing protein 1-like [Mizuhopecten yessoensis]|uniref:THUMP domain-containing protein 1 n=1 Tax=Mizuhopecten yessoensis TaxID=6573 RepID=A0A210QCQ4_MIZYE|nr:THUMP domain-containing protein 1-like [Mizuhopecten yessoensis]XP_021361601.1 THUMP domain-containing protein 1-like [Mizuhopecten yessoensis]XP_021361602.1 THUMP domain-containing protein 1-like [Mizuhopecten yessoensis]OWF46499.1 THUMP domain-containing protein 1 [Mizuhopecten yessoensis]
MSGNSGKRGKKRPKSYYLKCSQQNKRKVNRLEVDIRGFLLTCNSHEKDAVREAYSLLNEYADQIYGPEEVSKEETDTADGGPEVSSEEDEEEEDIAAALQKEVKAIKTTISSSNRRFQSVQTKAHNCLFIKTSLDDPCHLAHTIFTDLAKTRIQKSRYALRFLPIAGTCKAYEKDVKELAEKLLVKEFQTPFGVGLKYSVVFKSRNNSNKNLARTSAQTIIGQVIKTLNPLHSVNFDNPDVVVIVEVIGNVCCLGTARDFIKFRKYNLVEVVRSPVETKDNKKDADVEKSSLKQEAASSTCKDVPTDEDGNAVDSNCKNDVTVDSCNLTDSNCKNDVTVDSCNLTDSNCKDDVTVDSCNLTDSNCKDDVTVDSCNLIGSNCKDEEITDGSCDLGDSSGKDKTENESNIVAEKSNVDDAEKV